jgi:cellulose synthase operon protein C
MKKKNAIRLWVPSLFLCGVIATNPLASAAQSAAPAAQSQVRSQLENARALEQRHRLDLAIPVWKQVLESDPKNAEALGGLARAAAQTGDFTLASMYLDRLRVVNPGDPAIAGVEKLRAAAAGNAKPPALAWKGTAGEPAPHPPTAEEAAYQALSAKRIPEAEKRFKAILTRRPQDSGALAGMGYVRLEQRNYSGAISYLEQARQKRPADKAVADALQTARFRFLMQEGDQTLASGDTATAEKRYRSALDLRRAPEALSGLGQTLLARNDAAGAVPLFEQALTAQPASEAGWRGLVVAQSRLGNSTAAVSADERMPDAVRTALRSDPVYLQAIAATQLQAGRGGDAQGSLETALKLPLDDATRRSIQMQLANVLMARNQPRSAEDIYRQLTSTGTADVAAWQGLIRTQHALGRDDDALATLDRMPPPIKDAAVRQASFALVLAEVYRAEKRLDMAQDLLQKADAEPGASGDRNRIQIAIELAQVDIESGHPQLAYPLYQQVLREQPERADAWAGLLSALHLTGHDAEVMQQDALIPPAVRAQLQADAGYRSTLASAQALSGGAADRAQSSSPFTSSSDLSPDNAIENAWRLYAAGNDAALYRELMTVGARTDLNEAQRKMVQNIWADWALRRASQASATGGSARALAILNAASDEFAANAEVQRALASGFMNAGDAQRATAIFKTQNVAVFSAVDFQNAIAAALAASDDRSADTWLKRALQKFPSDPQILLLKARFEQARGNSNRAREYYQQSLKDMPPDNRPRNEAALPAAGLDSGGRLAALLAPQTAEAVVPQAPTLSLSVTATNPAAEPEQPAIQPATQPTPSTAAAASAGFTPYQPYIAPTRPTPVPNIGAATGKAEVPVQLGNNAAPPVQQQTEMTDVLPTARYVPNGTRPATVASDPNAAAAQAERVRRQRAAEAAQRGQSSAPTALVPQPSTQSAKSAENAASNTGAQQYPKPRTPPPASVRRASPRPTAPAAEISTPPAPPAEPVVTPPPVQTAPAAPPPPPALLIPVPAPETETANGTVTLPPGLLAAQAPIPTIAPRQQAQNALAAIESSYSGFAGITGYGRFRNGTAGLDRLYDVEAPTEISAVVGHAVRLTAVANPVFLNSGVLSGSGAHPAALPYIGTLPSGTLAVPAQQFSNGIGGEAQLATRSVGLAVGYTPYQFLVHNLTARVRLNPFGQHLTLYGQRQPVKDTQLSYSGLRDPAVSATSGPIWGGVLATTGGLRLALGNSASVLRVDAEGGVLTGRHVQDNTTIRGSAEASFRIHSWAGNGSLSLGGEFTGMHYRLNQNSLSYGQGGYFSPQWYFAGAVPVTITGGGDSRFHYHVYGAAGVRTFRQNAAAFFPLDASFQQIFPACASGVLTLSCGYYPQSVTTGFDYDVRAEGSYRFADHWYGGGFVASSNRNNYEDTSAGFFLRYTFRRQSAAEGRPAGLFVRDGIRPLQIP